MYSTGVPTRAADRLSPSVRGRGSSTSYLRFSRALHDTKDGWTRKEWLPHATGRLASRRLHRSVRSSDRRAEEALQTRWCSEKCAGHDLADPDYACHLSLMTYLLEACLASLACLMWRLRCLRSSILHALLRPGSSGPSSVGASPRSGKASALVADQPHDVGSAGSR